MPTDADMLEYIMAVHGLPTTGGLYFLKVDKNGEARLNFTRIIDPYFRQVPRFEGFDYGHKIEKGSYYYHVFFLMKRRSGDVKPGLTYAAHNSGQTALMNKKMNEVGDKDIAAFWKVPDRRFMEAFYPTLKRFSSVLDIGVRNYNKICKKLIGSRATKYFQLDPLPPKTMSNDGFLKCTVQQSLKKYPEFSEYFDAVVDFGVLGAGSYQKYMPTDADMLEYIMAVHGLLKTGGLYFLKVDKNGEARLNFTRIIDPYFRQVPRFEGLTTATRSKKEATTTTYSS